MNFKRTSKFQRPNPEDYKGDVGITDADTWWLVESESSSSKTYLLQIHMKLFTPKHTNIKTVDVGHTDQKGRIECDCPSFIYCKYTPRHCKHSIELARRFFGEKSFQYKILILPLQEEPDKWCGENYKIVEAMNGTSKKKKKYTSHTTAGIRYLAENPELSVQASRAGLTFHPTNK